MKKIIIAALAATTIVACCNTKKTTTTNTAQDKAQTQTGTVNSVQYTVVENFFLKNTVTFANEVNVLTAKDAESFNKLFGAAKTMTNKTGAPDFTKATAVAVALQASKTQTTLTVDRVSSDSNSLNIYITLKKGQEQSFSAQPVVILSLPKQKDGQKVRVFADNKEVASATI